MGDRTKTCFLGFLVGKCLNRLPFRSLEIEMSSVQPAYRNGKSKDYEHALSYEVDANGDPIINNNNGLKRTETSSDEDVASCSSKDDETDEIIGLKTR